MTVTQVLYSCPTLSQYSHYLECRKCQISGSGYICNFDRSPFKDGMMWQVTQAPSFLDKNWPINWSPAWLMTPGHFGLCLIRISLESASDTNFWIRCKPLDTASKGIIHASCSSSLCDVESSYRYANIIQIMINTTCSNWGESMCWVYFTHYLLRIM